MPSLRIVRLDDRPDDFDAIGRQVREASGNKHYLHSVRELVDRQTNPWFDHGEAVLFGAMRGTTAVGRIAPHIDYRRPRSSGRVGGLGLFECIEDREVAKALFDAAESWARTQHCASLLGPIDPCGFLQGGLVVDGFDSPAYFGSAHTPEFYPALFEANSYVEAATLLAWTYNLSKIPTPIAQIARAVSLQPGLEVVPLNLAQHLEVVTEIYNRAWHENWGFVPIESAEMQAFLGNGRYVDPEISFLATVDDAPAAIAIACPNFLEFGAKFNLWQHLPTLAPALVPRLGKRPSSFRQMLFGVVPEFRGSAIGGLGIHLYERVMRAARQLGYKRGESMWTHSVQEVLNGGLALMGARNTRTLRIFEKDL